MRGRTEDSGSGTEPRGTSAEASGGESAGVDVAGDLAVVVQELESFLDPEVIPDWLITEQYTLGGRTPVQALRDGDLAEVLQVVNATEHGAYL